jgi:hypothetical protein
MPFHVGQRVVCVNTRNWSDRSRDRPKYPKRGAVYTVRAIVVCTDRGYDEDGLYLEEIVNKPRLYEDPQGQLMKCEVAFRMSRFRPVRTTSIDVFTQMLEPVPQKPAELVDA